MNEETPKTREHRLKKHNYSYFEETMQSLSIGPTELVVACGYTGNTWHRWKKEGKMPAVARLACECLRRRLRRENDNPAAREIFVLLVPKDKTEALIAFCNALDVEQASRIPLTG